MHSRMSRRSVFTVIAGGAALAATGKPAMPAMAADGVKYVTTASVWLRNKPKGTAPALLLVPSGATVIDYDGEVVNSYRSVDYNGAVGWVHTDYLKKAGSTPPPAPNYPVIGTAKTSAAVNFRTGPGGGYSVIKVVAKGTTVEITAAVENGYRFVYVGGKAGWIADAYLGGSNLGAFVTTAAVNMRKGAGTSYAVIRVIPKGATVVDYVDETVNGFRKVDYAGTAGWVSAAYLKKA